MKKTAVGMFENSGQADAVVQALVARGFPAKEIRVLAEPRSMEVTGAKSTPDLDFHASLVQDLSSMGAIREHAEAYSQGVRQGRVLVFATGTDEQAGAAIEIMNHNGAVGPEELRAAEHLPTSESSVSTGRFRSSQESLGGARLFVW